MVIERQVRVENRTYTVVCSDKKEVLLAAKAAGRIAVGLRTEENAKDWLPVRYVFDCLSPAFGETAGVRREASCLEETPGDGYLERAVRRELGLPWRIAVTKRLFIRELMLEDLPQIIRDPEDTKEDEIFYTPRLLEAYIREQYGFYECGLWALVRRADDKLAGVAGVIPAQQEGSGEGDSLYALCGEDGPPLYCLGYHIYGPYRRRGYAKEACREILRYVEEEYGGRTAAYAAADNTASIGLLEALGFRFIGKCSGSGRLLYLYAGNC